MLNESQSTPSTASVTLTWSVSSGADNYTIMVTPTLPSGQSHLSTTTTSLQLMVAYNVNYSVIITVHNCAGNNSTFEQIHAGNQTKLAVMIPINDLILCSVHSQLAAILPLHLLMAGSAHAAVELWEPC